MLDAMRKHFKKVAFESRRAYARGRYGFDERAQKAFEELELPLCSTFAEVRKRYYECCRRFHPDAGKETSDERFLRTKEAYDVLKSAYEKRETDE